jgi:hypothetical protein
MDHFFGSISSLMSRLLRYIVENTVIDLVEFIENYSNGNRYEGIYDILSGLALPHLVIPIRVFFVPFERTGNVTMEPKLDDIVDGFDECIDFIVKSLQKVVRVEYQLFQNVQGLTMKYLKTVSKEEEIILQAKDRIKKVFQANSYGSIL